jgi:CBS domain-containing protein
MKCKDLMTRNPASCLPTDSVVTAAMLMKTQNVGAVPVVADRGSRRLIGIITDRDLALRVVAEQREYYNARVEDVMSRKPAVCRPQDDHDEALDLMSKEQIRRVPVVDDDGRLVGIIAQADVARHAKSKEAGEVVEQISEPAAHSVAKKSTTSLMIAGGLGLGAALVYLRRLRAE